MGPERCLGLFVLLAQGPEGKRGGKSSQSLDSSRIAPQKASPRRVRRSSLPSPRELAVFWSSPHDGQESLRNPDWRPARPRLRCSGAQQREASLEPAGGGTARVESSQERWCPLSSRVPSLATVLLRLKAPGGPTPLLHRRLGAPKAAGRGSGSAWVPGFQFLLGPARCELFRGAPSCALSQMGRGRERQFSETRTQAVNYLARATAPTLQLRPCTPVPAPLWVEEPSSPQIGSPERAPAAGNRSLSPTSRRVSTH